MQEENKERPPVNKLTGEDGVPREYFFPAHNKTVVATSLADAESKVEALIKADKKN